MVSLECCVKRVYFSTLTLITLYFIYCREDNTAARQRRAWLRFIYFSGAMATIAKDKITLQSRLIVIPKAFQAGLKSVFRYTVVQISHQWVIEARYLNCEWTSITSAISILSPLFSYLLALFFMISHPQILTGTCVCVKGWISSHWRVRHIRQPHSNQSDQAFFGCLKSGA